MIQLPSIEVVWSLEKNGVAVKSYREISKYDPNKFY